MAQFGTLSILDTLRQQRNTTVAQYGEDKTFDAVSLALAAHDAILNDMVSELVEFTTDQLRNTGGNATMKVERMGEYGRPAPQKMGAGATLGFPLDRYGAALQWTEDWFRVKTLPEMAANINTMMTADRLSVLTEIKKALYVPTNYTFADWMLNNIDIPVKRLANADGFPIPPDPDGNDFDADTHTHYLARAGGSLAESDVTALIATVREHFATGEIVLDINQAQEDAVRAFAGFTPYVDARIISPTDVSRGAAALDVVNIYDRPIGILSGAEVRVKPWVVAGFMFAHIMGNGPVLSLRTFEGGSLGALTIRADISLYPLRAQQWYREFGVGISNRVAGAILDTGHTSYTAPTL